MNRYNFDEIEIGLEASFETEITEEQMKMFVK